MSFQDWERNWDATHDATQRFMDRRAYESLHSFHHRLLLSVLGEVPSEKFLAELKRIEDELTAKPLESGEKEKVSA